MNKQYKAKNLFVVKHFAALVLWVNNQGGKMIEKSIKKSIACIINIKF